MIKSILIFLMTCTAFAAPIKDPLDMIDKDFNYTRPVGVESSTGRQYFFVIGRVVGDSVEIAHYNDLDLTGGALNLIGVPRDNDLGRTAGVSFRFRLQGTSGSISVDIFNWLFSRELRPKSDIQYVEEETTVAIRSRLFRDGKDNQYIIIGFSFTNRVQKPFVTGFLQQWIHSAGAGRHRDDIHRDGSDNFLNGIIGVGGRFDILKYRHIALYFTGEAELSASTDFKHESGFTVRAAAHLDVGGWPAGIENPILSVQMFIERTMFLDSSVDQNVGVELMIGMAIRRYFMQAGFFVARMNEGLDREYEGGHSWTTGILLRATHRSVPEPPPDYVFGGGH